MELRNKKKNIFLELKELEKKKTNDADENPEKNDASFTIEDIYKYVETLDKEREAKEREREEKEREMMMTIPETQDWYGTWDFSEHDWAIDRVNYKENYVKKDLERIAEYYGISKRKKKKDKLIQEIIQFEQNISNWEKTQRRKELWGYIEELKSDKYTSKFIVF